MPVTYFALWMSRLMGWMPELGHCVVCGADLRGGMVWYSATSDGVTCGDDRRAGSVALSAESVKDAQRIFRGTVKGLAEEDWPKMRGAELRRFAVRRRWSGIWRREIDECEGVGRIGLRLRTCEGVSRGSRRMGEVTAACRSFGGRMRCDLRHGLTCEVVCGLAA